MEKSWEYFADRFIQEFAKKHPGILQLEGLREIDPHYNDFASAIRQAMDFLTDNDFIRQTKTRTFYVCTTKGLALASSGVVEYLRAERLKIEREAETNELAFEKLKEELVDIRRKNKYWRYVAIAGLVSGLASFVLNLLQLFGVI